MRSCKHRRIRSATCSSDHTPSGRPSTGGNAWFWCWRVWRGNAYTCWNSAPGCCAGTAPPTNTGMSARGAGLRIAGYCFAHGVGNEVEWSCRRGSCCWFWCASWICWQTNWLAMRVSRYTYNCSMLETRARRWLSKSQKSTCEHPQLLLSHRHQSAEPGHNLVHQDEGQHSRNWQSFTSVRPWCAIIIAAVQYEISRLGHGGVSFAQLGVLEGHCRWSLWLRTVEAGHARRGLHERPERHFVSWVYPWCGSDLHWAVLTLLQLALIATIIILTVIISILSHFAHTDISVIICHAIMTMVIELSDRTTTYIFTKFIILNFIVVVVSARVMIWNWDYLHYMSTILCIWKL